MGLQSYLEVLSIALFNSSSILSILDSYKFRNAINNLKYGGKLCLRSRGCFCLLLVNTKVRKRKPLGFQES
jgi:hypothetical protein